MGDFLIFSTFVLIMKPMKKFSHKIFFFMFENMPNIFPHTTKHKMETKYFLFKFFPLEYFCVYLWNQLKSLASENIFFHVWKNAKHCSPWHMWYQMETKHFVEEF